MSRRSTRERQGTAPPARVLRAQPMRMLCESSSSLHGPESHPHDHDFRGFNESCRGLALLETHFARGIRRDDRRDALPADRKLHLRQQTAVAHFHDPPDQLIAPADAAEVAPPGQSIFFLDARKEAFDFGRWDAVMSAGRADAVQFLLVDPLLERGIADAQRTRGVAGIEQFVGMHGHLQKIHLYSY